ncbi:MAG: thermonuclease family protein [Hyphomonadaceae bacterium]
MLRALSVRQRALFRGKTRRRRAFGYQAFAAVALIMLGFLVWAPAARDSQASDSTATGRSSVAGRAAVIDGDTIEIQGQRIRLWGIDAPERDQDCASGAPGPAAAQALRTMLAVGTVSCTARDWDDYGRMVAQCRADDADVGASLVEAGWAWDYARYSGGRYGGAELSARVDGRGVWRMGCEPAWEWRQRDRA